MPGLLNWFTFDFRLTVTIGLECLSKTAEIKGTTIINVACMSPRVTFIRARSFSINRKFAYVVLFHLLFEHYPTFNHESTCIIYTVMYNIDFSFTYTLNNS